MTEIYYSFALKTKQEKRKTVNLKYENYDLSHLNKIVNLTLKNMRAMKNFHPKLKSTILQLLDKIIPDEYFGTKLHRKLFYNIVKKILTQSVHECMYSSTLIKGYDYKSIPWLENIVCSETCKKILLKINKAMLECVVKELVTFYYKPIKTTNGNEIKFFHKDHWDQFQTKVLNGLQKSQYLVKVGKADIKAKPRGFFKIIPKGPLENLNYRPIVNSFKADNERFLKLLVKKIYAAAKDMNKHFSPFLYDDWLAFVRKTNGEELFGAKFDVEDAFGNVDISHLCRLIEAIKREFLTEKEKTFLTEYVKNQFVIFKKYTYRWQHGLLQGDVLSAALCELYMARLDLLFIEKLKDDCFIHRTVDDYFFCSTEAFRVDNFVSYMRRVHTINKDKTISNLDDPSQEIPYCGKLFNLVTKEVKVLYSFPKGYEIRHKFKLWHFRRPILETDEVKFIHSAMVISFSSNYFSKLVLNTIFNSQKTVLENYFNGMVYVSYKFDATIEALRGNCLVKDFNAVYNILMYCIKQYVVKARDTIMLYKGEYYKKKMPFRLFLILALKAFVLVFKQRNQIYKPLILKVKKEYNLRVDFRDCDVDFTYFNTLPSCFGHVSIGRKVVI